MTFGISASTIITPLLTAGATALGTQLFSGDSGGQQQVTQGIQAGPLLDLLTDPRYGEAINLQLDQALEPLIQAGEKGIERYESDLERQLGLYGQDYTAGFDPFAQTGLEAQTAQRELLGLAGPEAQAARVQALEQSPYFQSIVNQGEQAILQNASATGGLRGGNVQRALSEFRPELLRQEIDRSLSLYDPLATRGFQATGIQAEAGERGGVRQAGAIGEGGRRIVDLITQLGSAESGLAVQKAQDERQRMQDIISAITAGSLPGGSLGIPEKAVRKTTVPGTMRVETETYRPGLSDVVFGNVPVDPNYKIPSAGGASAPSFTDTLKDIGSNILNPFSAIGSLF